MIQTHCDSSGVEQRWLAALLSQIDFCLRGSGRGRRDDNFDWTWFSRLPTAHFVDTRRHVRRLLGWLSGTLPAGYTTEWLIQNAGRLWQTRASLADELSCRQFDDAIALKIVGYRRAFFPPEGYDTYLELHDSRPFKHPGLPERYMDAPLQVLDVSRDAHASIIATPGFVDALNRYRQYFVSRAGSSLSPRPGETVLDCGACIGDTSAVFALHVGANGQVHMFDPLPVHASFCNLQKSLNPRLATSMHVVPMAVGATSNGRAPLADGAPRIQPSATPDSSFPFVSIDDYVRETRIRVDVIKMDIEGGEGDALKGAEHTLVEFRPRLMISAYHRTDDLWRLRELIQEINPRYKFHFGHHTPIQWESVIYAV